MFFLYCYVWIRGTFPRYRFDSLVKLVWKWLIPLSLVNLLVVALLGSVL
jgi:NADH-quinone oxidoreductase subunit H